MTRTRKEAKRAGRQAGREEERKGVGVKQLLPTRIQNEI